MRLKIKNDYFRPTLFFDFYIILMMNCNYFIKQAIIHVRN